VPLILKSKGIFKALNCLENFSLFIRLKGLRQIGLKRFGRWRQM